VREKYPDLYMRWLREPHKVTFPNGESLEQVRTRTMEAINKLIEKHQNETIALVAHRVPNKVICCSLLGIENNNFWRIQKVLGKPVLSDF